MNRNVVDFILIPLTVFATILLYDPIRIGVYKSTEPYFSPPIKTSVKDIVVRNDARGSGDFGSKRRNGRFHSGIDIVASVGTPVYASRSGVAFCGNVPFGYGRYVMIYHPDGYQSIYGHLSDWATYSTRKVRKGELIGYVGKTGNASNSNIRSHLHFEIRKRGEPQDPHRLMK